MTAQSFEKAVLACEKTLYRVSMAILQNGADAEDAVSEAILTAFRRRETLREEKVFSTWLVRILINTCKKALGVPVGTVKSRLARGRELLRLELE